MYVCIYIYACISHAMICTSKLDVWKINCAQYGITCRRMDVFMESPFAENCVPIIGIYPSNPFAFDFRPTEI